MDTNLVFNTYKRYKAGTARFTSWLVDAVQKSGTAIEAVSKPLPQKGPKTKDRKSKTSVLPSTSIPCLIPVRDFTKLADILVLQNTPIPSGMLDILDDVISLRKECSRWLGGRSAHSEDHNDTHQYFISVLERVKAILLSSLGSVDTSSATGKDQRAETPLANIFEALQVEEPQEKQNNTTPKMSTTQRKVATPARPTYDVLSEHDEVLLSSIFFFQDVNVIRAKLRSLWSDYRQGRSSLTTASIVTNTAIELLQRSCEEHLNLIKHWPDAPAENDLIYWTYLHLCPHDVHDLSDSGTWFNLTTAEQADFTSYAVYLYLEDWLDGLVSHRLRFVKRNLLTLQEDRSAWSTEKKTREDSHMTYLIASQFHNVGILYLQFPPSIDEVTKAFREAGKSRIIPLWLVLGMQIFLDITIVLREDLVKGFQDLQAAGDRITLSIRQLFQAPREMSSRKKQWHDNTDFQLLKLVGFVAEWIKKDKYADAIRKNSKKSVEEMGIELQPHFLLKHHPLLCGTMLYWLQSVTKEFGVSFTNAYNNTFAAAHLYNAARHSLLLVNPWTDIDFLIEVHTPKRLFIGGLPTTIEDSLKRFSLAMGASATMYARNRRVTKFEASSKDAGERRFRKFYPIHDILRERYCGFEHTTSLTSEKIEALMVSQRPETADCNEMRSIRDQWLRARKLTVAQLLELLQQGLDDDELHMHFDYIAMEARCAAYIKNLQKTFLNDAKSTCEARALIMEESYQDLELFEPSEESAPFYLLEKHGMKDSHDLSLYMTHAVLMSDPVAAASERGFNKNAKTESLVLSYCGVSLKKAAAAMSDVITKDGNTETGKAKGLVSRATAAHGT